MDFLFAPALWKSCLRQQERQASACLSTCSPSQVQPLFCRVALRLPRCESVILGARRHYFCFIGYCPFTQRTYRPQQVTPHFRQFILDLGRNSRKDGTIDEAIPFQIAQRGRQHLLGNALDGSAQFIETHRAITEITHHEHSPFIANTRQNLRYGPACIGFLEVTGFIKVPPCVGIWSLI